MKEDRASTPPDAGPRVLVGDQQAVVNVVLSPQGFVAASKGVGDGPIVHSAFWIVAPSLVWAQCLRADDTAWTPQTVGAEADRANLETANWRLEVALTLHHSQASPADRGAYGYGPGVQASRMQFATRLRTNDDARNAAGSASNP